MKLAEQWIVDNFMDHLPTNLSDCKLVYIRYWFVSCWYHINGELCKLHHHAKVVLHWWSAL